MSAEASVIYFKDEYTFDERLLESNKIRSKYPEKVPIIVEPYMDHGMLTYFKRANKVKLENRKYLVPPDLTLAQFAAVVRKRIKLEEHEALFFFVGNKVMPASGSLISEIYDQHKDTDNFLYFFVSLEKAFGC